MLMAGTIEPAGSEWAANVVLACKKEGIIRLGTDYGQLNERTKKDAYLFPRIIECLDALAGGGWFSTLDWTTGGLEELPQGCPGSEERWEDRRGIFRWKAMPFGLCNGETAFQQLMDIILSLLSFP